MSNVDHSTHHAEKPSDSGNNILLGALDQGTSSTRFLLFRPSGKVVASHQMEVPLHCPHPGWVEQDPIQILQHSVECINKVVGSLSKGERQSIRSIGITNQRETTVAWDTTTGRPLHNAIVWMDTRTSGIVSELSSAHGGKNVFRDICGLPISTYFSGLKMRWMIDHVPEVRAAIEEGRCAMGTIDSWLSWQLTRGQTAPRDHKRHCTDVTNASRTMLMNLKTLDWDDRMLSVFGIDKNCLPQIFPSVHDFGKVSAPLDVTSGCALNGVPISSCIGDQQSATVGQFCLNVGDMKNTYGTGCFMLMNTGTEPILSKNGLLTTVAYQLPNQKPVYALEGSISVAGAAVRFLRDNLCIVKSVSEVESLAASVEDTGDVYFVPAFAGLFAPHWRSDARGTIVGLTQYSTRAHLARATLEAVALQTVELVAAMQKDLQSTSTSAGSVVATQCVGSSNGIAGHSALRVDGGMTANNLMLQIQSNALQATVMRPGMLETTAWGAALLGGLGVGVWSSIEEIHPSMTEKWTEFHPQISASAAATQLGRWRLAVEKSMGWAQVQP